MFKIISVKDGKAIDSLIISMFERLKRLYAEGKLDERGITNAVAKGWITSEQLMKCY